MGNSEYQGRTGQGDPNNASEHHRKASRRKECLSCEPKAVPVECDVEAWRCEVR